jgi:hypothetical protein
MGWNLTFPRPDCPYINLKLPALYFRSLRNVFDLLRYIARPYVQRVVNRITISYYTYWSVTAAMASISLPPDYCALNHYLLPPG